MVYVEESQKPRAPRHVIDTLRNIEKILRMDRASFSMNEEESNQIKATIRPWVESWSHGPVKDLLAWATGAGGTIEQRQDGARFYARGNGKGEG